MTQTLTTDELRQIVDSHEKGYGMSVPINYGYLAARELLANREAQPVEVTDEMALAFHRALNDGGIGEADLEEIKVGLNGALCNYTAPPTPAVQNGWISCDERFPEAGNIVLVSSDGYVTVCEAVCSDYTGRYFSSVATGRELTVTHWMPLPAAPQPK